MKLFNKITLALGAMLLAASVSAQSIDLFRSQRPIVLSPIAILTAAASTVTNGPIDIGGYLGIGYVDITSVTNAGGALTATLEGSADTTNWVALSNFALINGTTSYTITNSLYVVGTNTSTLSASNPYLLPGTIVTPTPWSSGFATPYLNYAAVPYTNSGAITVTAKGVYRVGLNVQDARRYLHIVWTPTGSSSNDAVSATFNAVRNAEVQ